MSVEDHALFEKVMYETAIDQGFPIAEKRRQAWGNISMAVDVLPPDILDNKVLLALPNGTLDPEAGVLYEHDAENYTTRRIAIDFDPDASCPEWMKMLERLVSNKASAIQDEYTEYLQMKFGMSLFGFPPHITRDLRKGTVLFGESRTGKTTVAEVLRVFFHRNEIADENVEQLGKAYGLQRVMSARALIADDAAKKRSKIDPTVLKKLITGEPMTAEIKYQPNRGFRFRGPVFLTTNVRPEINDETDAMYDRLVVLTFDRVFTAKDKAMLAPHNSVVPFLAERGEFSGILNWAIQGGRKAMELKRYGALGDAKEAAKEWRAENDVVFDFLRRFGVPDERVYCSVPLLSQIISLYATEEHHAPKGSYAPKKVSNLLVREAQTSIPGSSVVRYDRADTSGNVIVGLKINDEGKLWEARAREQGAVPLGVKWKLNGKVL